MPKLKGRGSGTRQKSAFMISHHRGPTAGFQRSAMIGVHEGGPIAPAFVGHRALFQSDEGHTKALARNSTATDTGSKRQTLAGRVTRAGEILKLKASDGAAFPSESPGAKL